jgi:methylmalonyl-CoA mutase C-terminal domain/subunit
MSPHDKSIRVLIAKTSLDGHWRGVAVVSAALRDAGMEVIYGGQMIAEEIANAAVQEGVDVIGLNIGGSYGTVQKIMEVLHSRDLDNVLVIAGGTIPPENVSKLKQLGIAEVFPPGSRTDDIVSFVRNNVSAKDKKLVNKEK